MNSNAISASGAPLGRAKAAVIMLHGRGASAESMLSFADVFTQADVAYLAPQAPGSTWYPYSFLAPFEQNEPALSHALETVASTISRIVSHGLTPQRLVLLGFSQGGCLALEYAARNAQRYGGVVGLSAGLIGPPGAPPGPIPARCRARLCSWAAAMSTSTSLWRACTSPPRSCVEWGAR